MAQCERCGQLEALAQAYQQALSNTFLALQIALQPDTSDKWRAETLKRLSEDPRGTPQKPEKPS